MEAIYIGKQLLIMFSTGLAGFLIGKGLLGNSLGLGALEEIALLTPVGLGVVILLLFALGTLGILSPVPVLACIGLLVMLSLGRFRPALDLDVREALGSGSTARRLLTLYATILLLIPVVLTPLTPPWDSDEIRYHLPYALHFVEQNAITPDLYLRYPFSPLNINLLYVLALMIGDDVTTHFLHLLLGLLAALNLYCLALRLSDALTALSATLLFLTLPIFSRLSASGYIDLGLACFTFAAIVCLARQGGTRRLPLVICAGFLFGIGLGSKYLALVYLLPMAVWAWYQSRSIHSTLLFLSIALIVGLPWYVYNAIHTGNPFSPFAGELFGYWPWHAEDAADQIRHLDKLGLGHSPLALLKLPYNLVANHWDFSSPPIPLILTAVFPCLLSLPWMERKLRPFAVFLLAAILIWFFSAQEIRYLAAFLPLWCFFSVWFLSRLVALSGRTALPSAWTDRASRPLLTASSSLVLILVLYHYYSNHRLVFPPEAVQLVSNREAFLKKRLPDYGLIGYLRSSEIEDEKIYQMGNEALLTYVRNNRVIGDYFGMMGYTYFLKKYGKDASGFIEELKEEGVSYLAVRRDKVVFLRWEAYIRNSLAIEYEDDHVVLFVIPEGT